MIETQDVRGGVEVRVSCDSCRARSATRTVSSREGVGRALAELRLLGWVPVRAPSGKGRPLYAWLCGACDARRRGRTTA